MKNKTKADLVLEINKLEHAVTHNLNGLFESETRITQLKNEISALTGRLALSEEQIKLDRQNFLAENAQLRATLEKKVHLVGRLLEVVHLMK